MKLIIKSTVSFFCSLCLISNVSAQKYWDASRPDHRFTFGIRAGGNISKYYEENHNDPQFATGLQAGLVSDINIIRSLSVTTGVFYIQKKAKIEIGVSNQSVVGIINNAYFEIPLLLSYRIALSDAAHFQFNTGPYYAVRTTSSTLFKKTDLGMSVGVAVVYQHYYAGVNYERSLMNISNEDISNQNASKMYNGSIALSLGYNF